MHAYGSTAPVELFHPADPRYLNYWKSEKKKCIEGVYGECLGGYRHMPGNLYFYNKFCILQDTDIRTKETRKIKPFVQDLEWEQAYMIMEARGFSGYKDDDVYTSDSLWFEYNQDGIPSAEDVVLDLINSEGKLKKYMDPRTNIRRIHEYPVGRPLFANEACNTMVLGSRGGGKSYFEALAVLLYFLVFDGLTEYKIGNSPKLVELCLGSGNTDKSGEMIQKIMDAMNEFASNPDLGVWGVAGQKGWTPMPFFRDMSGQTGSGNKEKGGWSHNYKKKIGGRWVDGFGSGSKLYHVCYSDKKKDGAQAASGGRYLASAWEEVGESSIVQEGWNSNRATTRRNGIQFGMQNFLGTSGNMALIIYSKEMFTDPGNFRILSFTDVWESTGEIGFFLPAYLTYRQFKDKNGNTDLDRAKAYWLKGYTKAAESKNPKTLRMYCMNYPALPSHMWVTDKKYLLPYEESHNREKDLMKASTYKSIGTDINLFWDSSSSTGVNYNINNQAEPFFNFPLKKGRLSLDGGVRIFQFPIRIKGVIPPDLYIFLHDPYVSENMDEGESLGTTYVFTNPKYASQGVDSPCLVATFISKCIGGKKEYYETQEKLLAFYGNPTRGLWYEANRGDYCKDYYVKKKKSHLLCLRPVLSKGDNIFEKRITNYGFMVGNKIAKIGLVDDLHDLFLENIVYRNQTKKMIETIPCIWTIRQIMQFDLDGNFDGVSALLGLPLAIKEQEHYLIQAQGRKQTNRLAFLSGNKVLTQ